MLEACVDDVPERVVALFSREDRRNGDDVAVALWRPADRAKVSALPFELTERLDDHEGAHARKRYKVPTPLLSTEEDIGRTKTKGPKVLILMDKSLSFTELSRALESKDVDTALVAIEALRRELLSGSQVKTSPFMDKDDEERDDVRTDENLARLVPVASLYPETPRMSEERALVPLKKVPHFVSDVSSMRAVFTLHEGSSPVAVHRLGDSLVLDGRLSDLIGDVDPETGEVIVMVRKQERKAVSTKTHHHHLPTRDETTMQKMSFREKKEEPLHDFRRVVEWKFDDEIECVLGSDTLIYADNGTFVAAHDVGQRVSKTEAVEMWLENTVNAAPDCVVCYHRDGDVSGYQRIKTDDLPAFFFEKNAKELAQLQIRAKSIFTFLQRHCSDDAATYCLAKGPGDTVDLWKVHTLNDDDRKATTKQAPRQEKNKQQHNPFEAAVADLCLRIAKRCASTALKRRLLDRCVILDPLSSEVRLLLIEALLDDDDHVRQREESLLEHFSLKNCPWRVASADDTYTVVGEPTTTSSDDDDFAEAHVAALRHAAVLNDDDDADKKKRFASYVTRSRLALAALSYAKQRPGSALRHLAELDGKKKKKSHSLALALVFAQMARVVNESNKAQHERDLSLVSPLASSSAGSDDDEDDDDHTASEEDNSLFKTEKTLKKKKKSNKKRGHTSQTLFEVSGDPELNLTRAVKAAMRAVQERGREALPCLRAVYTSLGEQYLRVDRLTKAARHWSQGQELFRSLDDSLTSAWLKSRLATSQFRVVKREAKASLRYSGKIDNKHLAKIANAVEALEVASKELESCFQEDDCPSKKDCHIIASVLTIDAHAALQLATKTLAGARLELAVAKGDDLELFEKAAYEAEAANDDDLLADANCKVASHLARRGHKDKAVYHFRKALDARRSNNKRTLAQTMDALTIRVDLATALLRDSDDCQVALADLLDGAVIDLQFMENAFLSKTSTEAAFTARIVLRSFLSKLTDVLKANLLWCHYQKQDEDGGVPETKGDDNDDDNKDRLKAAYGAALRVAASCDEPRNTAHHLADLLTPLLPTFSRHHNNRADDDVFSSSS